MIHWPSFAFGFLACFAMVATGLVWACDRREEQFPLHLTTPPGE